MLVTTLCGYVDELGNGEIKKEGPFNDCGKIDSPTWFSFDPKFPNLLYLTQDNGDQGKSLYNFRFRRIHNDWIGCRK